MANAPLFVDHIEAAVDHVLDTVAGDIVLGIPLGIGKPNPFVNALYRRIKGNPARRLRIVTALSLERPVGKTELEQNFLGPLVERVFKDYPDLDYVKDLRAHALPPNIEVNEFFFLAGSWLHSPQAQQNYIAANYTHAFNYLLARGVNVVKRHRKAQGNVRINAQGNRYAGTEGELQVADILIPDVTGVLPIPALFAIHKLVPFNTGPGVGGTRAQ